MGKSKKIISTLGSYAGYKSIHNPSGPPPPIIFESTWKTDNEGTSNDDQISLPLESGGTYDFKVDWGDGSSDTITVWNQAEVTHTYPSAGTYTVKITGTINGWRFNNTGDKLKILTIESWGSLLLGNNNSYFFACMNLVINATDVLDVSSITDFKYGFRACNLMTSIDVSSWDVSNATTLYGLFHGCDSLTSLDVSSWDVSSVTEFKYVFRACSSLTSLDVSSWNTSNGNDFYGIFYQCSGITSIGVSNWDITSATSLADMFKYATLTTVCYDEILIAWEGQAVQNNVNFHGGDSKYTGGGAAEAARTALINDHAWVITDGGVI